MPTRPGISVCPLPSMIVAPFGGDACARTEAMRPSRRTTVWSSIAGCPLPSITRTCVIATSAWATDTKARVSCESVGVAALRGATRHNAASAAARNAVQGPVMDTCMGVSRLGLRRMDQGHRLRRIVGAGSSRHGQASRPRLAEQPQRPAGGRSLHNCAPRFWISRMVRSPALSCLLLVACGVAAAAEPLLSQGAAYQSPDAWRQPVAPVRIADHTWAIGTAGITALLLKTDDGALLIDGGVPQAAGMLLANMRTLGVAPGDLKLILTSHVHGDHAGPLAAIKRATGAQLLNNAESAVLMANGGGNDIH